LHTRYSPAVLEGIAAGERAVIRLALVRGAATAASDVAAAALARGEELAEAARAHEPPVRPIACKSGCSACCTAMVLAAPAEVVRIAEHLRRTHAPEVFTALIEKVHLAHGRSRGLSRAERLDARVPCPLLDAAGACSVHALRPLVCAGWNSLDAAACDAHFNARTEALPPPLHGQSHELCHAVLGGLVGASLDLGLDGRPVELHGALALALADATAGERWLRGEPVFAAAAP
jgi:hypothetical protein